MIEKVNLPQDIKKLNTTQLNELASEIRECIIAAVDKNGGHLSSNLGMVELTLALHKVFNAPMDKLVFDVGHQCYAHKIITGRREALYSMRTTGGISGFMSPVESEYDVVTTGHSSTSLSQALGMCRARDLKGEDFHVVAVIGDGALSSGMAFEALNDIGNSKTKLIIVLNDNEMSIEKNVGALSKHLSKLRLSSNYINLKKGFRKFIFSIPLIGKPIRKITDAIKKFFLRIFVSRSIFDAFGISYAGTFDGHDIPQLVKALKNATEMDKPVLLHVYTKKGKGYAPAEANPDIYHSIKKGFVSKKTEFSSMSGKTITALASENSKIVAVTAAMKDGTGLSDFANAFPQRFFDVGICEEHAVTMCAGLAYGGYKPYFYVYSTFLQRAFDQISNDICLPALSVTFVIDKSGLVGSDGETHHGLLDCSILKNLPNMTVFCAKDAYALDCILRFSQTFNAPLAIRYENDYLGEFNHSDEIEKGKWEILSPLKDFNIISYGGRMLHTAFKVKDLLNGMGIETGIINAAFIKPIDVEMIASLKGSCAVIEESLPHGSLYNDICSVICQKELPLKAVSFCLPDKYITHGNNIDLLSQYGLSAENIAQKIISSVKTYN